MWFQFPVRPRLATKEDMEALWENLDVIDCFATDHGNLARLVDHYRKVRFLVYMNWFSLE